MDYNGKRAGVIGDEQNLSRAFLPFLTVALFYAQ